MFHINFNWLTLEFNMNYQNRLVALDQSPEAAENADCFSAEG